MQLVILNWSFSNSYWSRIDIFRISCEIALKWMPQDLADDKFTLGQEMACCHQTRSHYLTQRWLRSKSPYGITRPQWVNGKDWLALMYLTQPIKHLLMTYDARNLGISRHNVDLFVKPILSPHENTCIYEINVTQWILVYHSQCFEDYSLLGPTLTFFRNLA